MVVDRRPRYSREQFEVMNEIKRLVVLSSKRKCNYTVHFQRACPQHFSMNKIG